MLQHWVWPRAALQTFWQPSSSDSFRSTAMSSFWISPQSGFRAFRLQPYGTQICEITCIFRAQGSRLIIILSLFLRQFFWAMHALTPTFTRSHISNIHFYMTVSAARENAFLKIWTHVVNEGFLNSFRVQKPHLEGQSFHMEKKSIIDIRGKEAGLVK